MTNTDAIRFYSEHPPVDAFQIADRLLGTAVVRRGIGFMKGRPIYRIEYAPDFNIAGIKRHIREELDNIGWLFLTVSDLHPIFGMSPILPRMLQVGYHATRASLIPRICGRNGEGLLPSNADRAATDFPDTENVIHVCEKLTHEGNENDSAEWWMKTLSERNIVGDPHWGIVRIDMTGLPTTARIYQDMHSASGVIVDRIDRIPGRLIEPVSEIEQ